MIDIDPASTVELKATILSVKAAPKNIQQNVKRFAKSEIVPVWQQELTQQHATPLQQKLLVDTGRASVTNNSINLRSGGINAKVSGGLSTDTGDNSYRAAEFGANRFLTKKLSFDRSRRGKLYPVRNRHTQRQFEPTDHKGYVVFPAARAVIPRVAKLWSQTVVRTLHEMIEGSLS